ncbi:MAG: UDP-N-acetylglucosamine--N-acetylmuramyl-(pentapeptide) pyrophosphoryl-undecaprenol N-acetylglucosamine transferase [Actinobacteria bacterium]|nr:UDP-N-acetylglucosamine--N-acetylmuramyl-(pentapeptide) pyrophosphoryl-undecaprenol N-acetylglucosamine transferase [Actinomycetota bacterium]
MNKKVIIAAGGTAGHIYPAVSIIEHILLKYPDTEITFIGTGKDIERELTSGLDIIYKKVRASGLAVASGVFKKIIVLIKFFFNLSAGFFKAFFIINSFKPVFVLGMGGYVCAPVFLAALLSGKKIALHEQNYIPGRLNRFFAKFSRYVFLSFENSGNYLKKSIFNKNSETVYTGNLLRRSVRQYYKNEPEYEKWGCQKERKTVISFGGSLGAEKINSTVAALYDYLRYSEDMQIILISGTRFYEGLKEKLEQTQNIKDRLIFKIYPYVDEIYRLYRFADLIISRAGASTVAELEYTMIPSILIPYPQAIDDHQYYNARYLEEKKMAKIIRDKDLNPEMLLENIKNVLENMHIEKRQADYEKYFIDSEKRLDIITNKILAI